MCVCLGPVSRERCLLCLNITRNGYCAIGCMYIVSAGIMKITETNKNASLTGTKQTNK